MNKKAFWAVVIAALLLGSGIAVAGWFVSQQGVYYYEAQMESIQIQLNKQLDQRG